MMLQLLSAAISLGSALTPQVSAAPVLSARQEQSFGPVPSTVGRLVIKWTDRGDQEDSAGTCTGSVIQTAAGNVVLTAAHCIFDPNYEVDGRSGIADHVTFAPNFDWNKVSHFGEFTSQEISLPTKYITEGYTKSTSEHDYAVIVFKPNSNGDPLSRVVGGNALVAGVTDTVDATVWGYPRPKYNTERAVKCQDHTTLHDIDRPEDPNFMSVPCEMGPGASGGPWFSSLVDDNVGYIFAVTSQAWGDADHHMVAATPITQEIFDFVYGFGKSSASGSSGAEVEASAGHSDSAFTYKKTVDSSQED